MLEKSVPYYLQITNKLTITMHLFGLVFNIAFVLLEFFALQYCNWLVFQLATKRISLFYTRHHICKFM